jgi:hypothetical protein
MCTQFGAASATVERTMSIRITIRPESEVTIIKIDGWLSPDDIQELARTLEEVGTPAALDLTDLQSVDRSSVALLRQSIAAGTELRGVSPYIELLLQKGNAQ